MNARPSCPLATPARLRTLLLTAACLTSPLVHAQSRCTPADLDISFRFGAYSPSSYIVVLLARNVSPNACLLDTNLRPAFYALSEPTPLDIRVIPDSDHPQPFVLDPSFTAHQTIRWQTTQPAGAPPCIKPSVLNLPVNGDTSRPAQIVSPSLLQPICSQVAFATYALGPTFGDDDTAPVSSEPELTVASGLSTYHPGESFILHAEAMLPNAQPPAPGGEYTPIRSVAVFSPFGCPHFLVRQRAFDGSTRLEEYSGSRVRCSRQFRAGLTPTMTANFDAVPPVQGNALGESSVQVMELTGPLNAQQVAFAQSNPITLHVVPENTAGTKPIEDLTPYDGWETAFTLTDTSFGKQSGLLDQSTHLEWLRLSATRNKSQEEIRRAMYPHKAFDGWRYATADEVAMFFRHFTGALSGRTTDPAVVMELQRLVGGPFDTKKIAPGRSTRSITYGRIAGYYPYTTPDDEFVPASAPRLKYYYAEISVRNDDGQIAALADPHRIGGIDGDRNSSDTGTFLVREH